MKKMSGGGRGALVALAAALLAICKFPISLVLGGAFVVGAVLSSVFAGGTARRRAVAPPASLARFQQGLARRSVADDGADAHSPHPHFGTQPRTRAVNELLDHGLSLLLRDFVTSWAMPLLGPDPRLHAMLKSKLWDIVDGLQVRLGGIDLITLLSRDLVVALCSHLQTVAQSPKTAFPVHPCLASPAAEMDFLRQAAMVILRATLHPTDLASTTTVSLLREIIASKVLHATIHKVGDPDYINQFVLYKVEQQALEAQRRAGIYEYAQTYAGFLRLIDATNSVRDLQDIRYNTIAEIMQASHINELKELSKRKGAGVEAFVLASDKAELLHGRNLKRYINQLHNAKLLVEKRIVMLGGPVYGNDAGGTGAHAAAHGLSKKTTHRHSMQLGSVSSGDSSRQQVLSLFEILKDGIALGFFLEFLQQSRAHVNLKFWLAVSYLQETVERRGSAPAHDVLNCIEIVRAGRAEDAFVQMSDESLREIEKVVSDIMVRRQHLDAKLGARESSSSSSSLKVPRSSLAYFFQAQQEVYQYMYNVHYRRFIFSEIYRSYVRQAEEFAERRQVSELADVSISESLDEHAHDMAPKAEAAALPPDALLASSDDEDDLSEWDGEQNEVIDHRRAALEDAIKQNLAKQEKCRGHDERRRALELELDQLRAKALQLEHSSFLINEWSAKYGLWTATIQSADVNPDVSDAVPLFLIQVSVTDGSGGWIVVRREADFLLLHKQLRECSDKLPVKLPGERWSAWSARRKGLRAADPATVKLLNEYLNFLLRDEVLSKSETLFHFLNNSTGPRPKTTPTGFFTKLKELVGLVDPSDDTRFDGNVAGDDSEITDPTAENTDSIAEPLYVLISEVFELKGVFKWLRRQLIFFVQLTYGSTINRGIKQSVDWLFEDEQLTFYVQNFITNMFPDTWSPAPQRTLAQKEATRAAARDALLENPSKMLSSLLGVASCRRGTEKLFGAFQNRTMNKHLCYTLLEMFLVELIHELDGRDLAGVLVELDLTNDWV